MRMAHPVQSNRLHRKGGWSRAAHRVAVPIVRVQCKLRRIEVEMWEARNTEGLFWAVRLGAGSTD